MGLFELLGEGFKGAGRVMGRGTEKAIRGSEKMLRIQRLKMDVQEMRDEKEQKMKGLAHKVYELYAQNKLSDPDLLALCQEVKTLQWQIDERWTEINHLNKNP